MAAAFVPAGMEDDSDEDGGFMFGDEDYSDANSVVDAIWIMHYDSESPMAFFSRYVDCIESNPQQSRLCLFLFLLFVLLVFGLVLAEHL